jgi:hypothetical protein
MQELITSFIIQSKECRLKGIGKFESVIHPAQADIANKQIVPPVEERTFKGREDRISDELVKYAANKYGISMEEAMEKIKDWCADAKSKLKQREEVFLESLGSLRADQAGNISFHPLKAFPFFEPITVQRVVHENSTHAMLVGDRETTSSAMNQFYHDEKEPREVRRNNWKMISVVLGAIALLLIFFYFYNHSFSLSGIGNQEKAIPQTPSATYTPR